MVRIVFISFFLLFTPFFAVKAQLKTEFSLGEACEMLEKRWPTLQNAALLRQISEKETAVIRADRLPVISLKADGSWQSQTVSLEASGPNPLPFEIDRPTVSGKAYLEAVYMLSDGGFSAARNKISKARTAADLQKIETERYALREKINQLFIGIRMSRARVRLFNISLNSLKISKKRIAAAVENGVLSPVESAKAEVKEMELSAQKDDAAFRLKGLISTLSELTGAQLSDSVHLQFPELPAADEIPEIARPELAFFDQQKQAILAGEEMLAAARRPKLSIYAQGGTGYPNPLNFLDKDPAPFALAGLQFNWKITDWKKRRTESEKLRLQGEQVENRRKTFEFNLQTAIATYRSEVERLEAQIAKNEEVVKLQTAILVQVSDMADEGVISTSDYLVQVNAELAARQKLLILRTELLKIRLDFAFQRGGFSN